MNRGCWGQMSPHCSLGDPVFGLSHGGAWQEWLSPGLHGARSGTQEHPCLSNGGLSTQVPSSAGLSSSRLLCTKNPTDETFGGGAIQRSCRCTFSQTLCLRTKSNVVCGMSGESHHGEQQGCRESLCPALVSSGPASPPGPPDAPWH